MAEVIYAGSAKEKDGKFGKFLNVGLNVEKLKEHMTAKGWVNVTISPRKEVGKYGETHTVVIDQFVPKKKDEAEAVDQQQAPNPEDLPF